VAQDYRSERWELAMAAVGPTLKAKPRKEPGLSSASPHLSSREGTDDLRLKDP
jgi:hypothetical protein